VKREMIGQKGQRISRGLLGHDMLAVRTSPQSGPHRQDCHLPGWLVGVRAGGRGGAKIEIESFHTHGTRPLPDQRDDEEIAGQDDLSEKGIAS